MAGHDGRLSRRRFLQLGVALGAATSGGLGLVWPHAGQTRADAGAIPTPRIATWTLTADDFTLSSDGFLISPVWTAPFPFNALGARWNAASALTDLPPRFDFRVSDGGPWSSWFPAPPIHGFEGVTTPATDVLAIAGSLVQFRVHPIPGVTLSGASLAPVVVTTLDTQAGPTAEEAERSSQPFRPPPGIHAAIVNPNQIGRLNWGAQENYRFKNGKEIWPRQYLPARKIIVHHTVTANGEADPAATVRAIYSYHAVTLGWGDIGYNFLIDRNGRVYEGRAGGINAAGLPVMGGHALQYNAGSLGIALLGTFTDRATPVPDAMKTALANLISYKVVQHGVHPTGKDFFIDKSFPNIAGHRDCVNTACPGDAIQPLLPALREQALANLPPLGQAWVSQQIPAAAKLGATISGSVTIRNSGSQPWTRAGDTPYRVGCRWLLPDGKELQGAGTEARFELPQDVPPGQEVAVPLRLQAPRTPGSYILRVDMIQETVTWFSARIGNEPLNVPITVSSDLPYRADLPWVTRGH